MKAGDLYAIVISDAFPCLPIKLHQWRGVMTEKREGQRGFRQIERRRANTWRYGGRK